MQGIRLTWYGRCCFLFELGITRVLIDPHDTFDGVDMGRVDADYCLISSVAHDHGHVGASPYAFAVGTPGMFVYEDVIITGIESRESRGTPNIIFNIRYKDYSITNFADFGDAESLNNMTVEERAILRSTNIALVRPNYADPEETIHCGELALKFCDPKMLIVHHYYPESVISRSPNLASARSYFDKIQRMLNKLSYTRSLVSSYELDVDTSLIAGKKVFLFEQVHPQVHVGMP